MLARLDVLDSSQVVTEALALVDARFRDIPSLEEIIAEVSEKFLIANVKSTMESHGWTTKVRVRMRRRLEDLGASCGGDCSARNT